MAEDTSAMPVLKREVLVKVLAMDKLKLEAGILLKGKLKSKQPVLSVYLFHGNWSLQSEDFLPHFEVKVGDWMKLYGYKVRYLQTMVGEGSLKKATTSFGITTFPTIMVRTNVDQHFKFPLQELNGGSNAAPEDSIPGFKTFIEKVEEKIEEELIAAEARKMERPRNA